MNSTELLKLMLCPSCQGGKLKKDNDTIVCEKCARVFPIINDIPILMDTTEEWGKKADKDRLTYNAFYTERIKLHNGWWEKKADRYLNLRDEHNLRTSRWFVCELIHAKRVNQITLDAGGGEGYVSNYLLNLYSSKKQKPDVICYDLSDELLADGKRRYEQETMHYIAGDIQHIAFADNSVDVVLCIETIEHVRDLDSFAQEMYRILKPGGKLYLSTPNKRGFALWFNDRGAYFIYNFFLHLRNIFSSKKVKVTPVDPYGYYEGEDGYERYQTAGNVRNYFTKPGLKVDKQYYTEWITEVFFMGMRAIKFPVTLLRPFVSFVEWIEKGFRGTAPAELIGFTQIGVFVKPKKD